MNVERRKIPFGEEPMEVECGRLAKQADGAILIQVGGTVLLAAVTVAPHAAEDQDFFPLMVDYREKFYAAGRIPADSSNARASPATWKPCAPELLTGPFGPYSRKASATRSWFTSPSSPATASIRPKSPP